MANVSGLRLLLAFAEQKKMDLIGIYGSAADQMRELSRTAQRVPAHMVIDLMEAIGIATGDDAFGLTYAQLVNLRQLGPISLIWENCQNLAAGMRITQRHLSTVNAAITLRIEWDVKEVALVFNIAPIARRGSRHFIEALLVSTTRLARVGLGLRWSPKRVELMQSAPRDSSPHRRFFQTQLDFDTERCAIVCDTDDFFKPFAHFDAETLTIVEHQLERLTSEYPRDFVTQVEMLITSNMSDGRATLDHIAGLVSMSRRTLQRRLDDHSLSFAALLERVRKMRAEQYFKQENYPRLGQLAQILGYSEASAVSRFLREKAGVNSSALRRN